VKYILLVRCCLYLPNNNKEKSYVNVRERLLLNYCLLVMEFHFDLMLCLA